MNSRTAKLINRFAAVTAQKPCSIKRAWLALKATDRFKMRTLLKAEIKQASQ